MTDCYAVVEEGHDVIVNSIQQVIDQNLCTGTAENIKKTLVTKIYNALILYKEQGLRPCKPIVLSLEGPCLELRIKLPGSKNLLRSVFRQQEDKILLFTGGLIKPEEYDDKRTKERVDSDYKNEIERCKKMSKDFFGEKRQYQYKLLCQI